jgi:hypothetical protein
MAQDWDIKPREEACAGCQTPFADEQAYFSALVFDTNGYKRADYCEKCWLAKDEETVLPYSMWQGVYRMPAPEPEEPLKKETAETLLRKLMEDDDPTKANVIYILAVMLERNRLLVERDIQKNENGTLIRVYEHRKTGETFLVPDPRLRLDQLETVQQEVIAMLGGPAKKNEPAAPPADKENAARH